MGFDIKPRKNVPTAGAFRHDVEVLLAQHPEAFDVIVWVAKPTEENETIAENAKDTPVTVLDREERKNAFMAPVKARAYVVPSDSLGYEVSDSGEYEVPGTGSEPLNLLVSVNVTTFSLIQWREVVSLDPEEIEERTVYVSDIRTAGHTFGNPVDICTCWPLPAAGEVPEDKGGEDTPPDVGAGSQGATDTGEDGAAAGAENSEIGSL